MPISSKPCFAQARNRRLRQQTVLKASSRQRYAFLVIPLTLRKSRLGHPHHHLGQRVMKLPRHLCRTLPCAHVIENRYHHRSPIQNRPDELKLVQIVTFHFTRQRFQLDRCLSFEANRLPQAKKGSDGIEQPSRTRRARRVQSRLQHRRQRLQFCRCKSRQRRAISSPPEFFSKRLTQQSGGRTSRLLHRLFASRQQETSQVR